MNGDMKTLYDAVNGVRNQLEESLKSLLEGLHDLETEVVRIGTRQGENHKTNKDDITVLFDLIREMQKSLTNLPCREHIEKFKHYDDHVRQGNAWRIAIVIACIGLLATGIGGAISYGELRGTMNEHLKVTEHMQSEIKDIKSGGSRPRQTYTSGARNPDIKDTGGAKEIR